MQRIRTTTTTPTTSSEPTRETGMSTWPKYTYVLEPATYIPCYVHIPDQGFDKKVKDIPEKEHTHFFAFRGALKSLGWLVGSFPHGCLAASRFMGNR